MVKPLIVLFLLGGLQGLVGWLMVLSGLEDSELLYVSHYKLAIHFILALVLICYALWFAVQLLVPSNQLTANKSLRSFTGWLIALLVLQLIYGAFMAGLKAAAAAPTWPTINGVWWPVNVRHFGDRFFPGISYLADHPLVIHFIHRNLAYIVTLIVIIWTWKASGSKGTKLFHKARWWPLAFVLLQLLLGVFTVLNSVNADKFIWLAVAHQFIAMVLLLSLVLMVYIIRAPETVNE